MATIDSKPFIDSIIANNGWHESCLDDKDAPDNPRVAVIVEYTNAYDGIAYGVTFVTDRDQYKYLIRTEYVRNPKIIWKAADHPLL